MASQVVQEQPRELSADEEKRKQRQKKYNTNAKNTRTYNDDYQKKVNALSNVTDMDLEQMTLNLTVKGTCTKLEKTYFRLTSAPDPADVRPEHILKKALKLLKKKWKETDTDYRFIDD